MGDLRHMASDFRAIDDLASSWLQYAHKSESSIASCGGFRTHVVMLTDLWEPCFCWRFPANAEGDGFCPEDRRDGVW